MIEKKSFFTENNKLNKGYKSERKSSAKESAKINLPDAEVLAEYEAMQPGITLKMVEMTAKEQEHRHAVEVIHLKMQKTALRMGRIFAVFTVIAICYTSLTLAANNMQDSAILFASIGFLAVAISSLVGRNKICASDSYNRPKNFVNQVKNVSDREVKSFDKDANSSYKSRYRRRKKI